MYASGGNYIGTRGFSTGSFQWQPTRNSHDPNPPILVETTSLAATRGLISWAEVETPNVPATPTRGLLSWAELETPLVGTRGRISWAEVETPIAPTRGRISFAEVEFPFVGTRGRVSFTEFECQGAPTRGRISFVEMETPSLAVSSKNPYTLYLGIRIGMQ